MIDKKTVLALIPARAGSKGLPGKNIKNFCGRPLIAWTIEAAKKVSYIDTIIVSTDNKDIARVACKYGATVPFLRPAKLSTDSAKAKDVILHAMRFLEKRNNPYDIIVFLQPTSPLRNSSDISKGLRLFIRKNAHAVVSVSPLDYSPLWANTLPKNHSMAHFIKPEIKNKSRQQLDTFYRINGAIYIAKWDFFKKNKSWYSKRTFAFIMKKEHSIDIDEKIDFLFAETLQKNI